MKSIIIAAFLLPFTATPAAATPKPADAAGNVGINFSVDSVIGIHGEFNISSMANNAPVSVQVFWKNYSQKIAPSASWGTTGVGVAAIYDFNSIAKLNKKIHPYAGIGLISVSHKWKGTGPAWTYTGVGGGLYITGGVRYSLTPEVAADLNFNDFGNLTAGININF